MALQDVFDPAIEPLDHAVCLRSHWWCETMLDAEISAKLVKLMLSRGRALAQAKQPVGKSLAVVGQYPSDLHRSRTGQVTQETARIGSSLCWIDAHKDPAGRPIDGDKEVTPSVLIGHLRQVFDVDMQIARLICLEGSVCRLGFFRLQVAQVAHTMAAQAAIKTGARYMWVQELTHHREQVIQRQQQRRSQCDSYSLLRRAQCRLKLVRCVAEVVDAITLAPLPDGLFRYPVAFRHHPCRISARLDRSPDLRRRRRLLVKRNQHLASPSRTSRKINRAMKSADRRGSM